MILRHVGKTSKEYKIDTSVAQEICSDSHASFNKTNKKGKSEK